MTSELERKARAFAGQVQDVLNRTVCSYVQIKAIARPFPGGQGPVFTVGSGLSRSSLAQPTCFPVRIDQKKPRLWMNVSFQVRMDEAEAFLTAEKSFIGIFATEDESLCLAHFDFERDKDIYTCAHVQVHGRSPALQFLNRRGDEGRPLEALHFPVGGKRFRPCLEDVLEFLIAERLTDAHADAQEVLEASRAAYHRSQLKAAMRRDPVAVREFLAEQKSDLEKYQP